MPSSNRERLNAHEAKLTANLAEIEAFRESQLQPIRLRIHIPPRLQGFLAFLLPLANHHHG